MTHQLLKNRYQQQTPTHIQPNGCSISTPIYFTPTTDQNKALLNGFRDLVHVQRQELGIQDDHSTLTPAEVELGMSEESLRYALFGRRGTPERLLIKLQQLTGIKLVSRQAIEQTFNAWLDVLELEHENKRTKRANQTSKGLTPTGTPA